MRNLLKETKEIIEVCLSEENRELNNIEFTGITVYLLTEETMPYKAYLLNLESNKLFTDILKKNLEKINSEEILLDHYNELNRPDFPNECAFVNQQEVSLYFRILEGIERNNQSPNTITKKNIETAIKKSKGYVIRFMYHQNEEDKSIYAFFRMTKGALLSGHDKVLTFSKESSSLLKESTELQLRFGDKIVAIGTNEKIFILNGNNFDILFKYEELVNSSAIQALNEMRTQNLIKEFEHFHEYCSGNLLMKRKLHKILQKNNINSIDIERFKEVKEVCGDKLMIVINEDNTISVESANKRKSVEHILRVYNDEGAQTIISKEPIFAERKIAIE